MRQRLLEKPASTVAAPIGTESSHRGANMRKGD